MKHKVHVIGQPSELGVTWLDEVEKVASPGVIKTIRKSRGELVLKVLPNRIADRLEKKRLEKKRQKQLEREQDQQGKVTPE